MTKANHNESAFRANVRQGGGSLLPGLRNKAATLLVATVLGCLAAPALPCPALAASDRPVVGERYIFNNAPAPTTQSPSAPPSSSQLSPGAPLSPYTTQSPSPQDLLRREPSQQQPTTAELLDPDSRPWTSAPGLVLRRRHAETRLAENVLAATGDGSKAAASLFDGTVLLYGTNAQCTNPGALSMPSGHPAFALAMGAGGTAVAAWAPGKGAAILFDLSRQGCPTSALLAPLAGDVTLRLSTSGAVLVAQDGDGVLWSGVRPDPGETNPMRRLGTLPQQTVVFDFTPSEGILVLVEANGRGTIWNPRAGKLIRQFEVAGGPFVRGELVHDDVWLWTAEDKLVVWDLLRNIAVDQAKGEEQKQVIRQESVLPQASQGKLDLRGTTLFYVGERRGWRVFPLYDFPHTASLLNVDRSSTAACLRLADIDGEVRYYSSKTGLPVPQCFAEDWTPVPVRTDGSATTPELSLRLFEPLAGTGSGSKVYARAISRGVVYLWRGDVPKDLSRAEARVESKKSEVLGSVVEKEGTLSISLRQGLSASEVPQQLELVAKTPQ